MLIAEDLLLLLTDDETGKLCAPSPHVDIAIAGANLIELTMRGKIELSPGGGGHRPERLLVRDATATGDQVLDTAVQRIAAHEEAGPAAALKALAKDLREELYERMAQRGLVRSHHHKVLGLLPRHTWPAEDAHHEGEVRRSIARVLTEPSGSDPHVAALVALLHALRCEDKVIDHEGLGLSKDELRDRAATMASGQWASDVVRRTIDAMVAAVIAATTAATSTVVLPGAG